MKKTSTPQNHLVEIVTPEIQNARVDKIQGRKDALKIINKITGENIDTGLDDFNACILINEYQNDDYIIVDND